MQERRHIIRWDINKQAAVRFEDAKGFTSCMIKNICFKGMQVSLPAKLPKDTFLKLSIFLAEGFTLDVEAWVAWHKTIANTDSYGIYFSKIKDPDKDRIYTFVHDLYPEQLGKCWWKGMSGITENKEGKEVEDRRIFSRMPVKSNLRYLGLESGEGKGEAQDICAKGLCILINKKLIPQTSLEMWIEIANKEPFYTRGEVKWSEMIAPDRFRVGVELEQADLMGLGQLLRGHQEHKKT